MAKKDGTNATIHERIALCVKYYGDGKNTVFAEKLGISEGNIRGYIKGVVPKADVLEKIVRTCDISPEWLLTGRGEMLKQDVPPFATPDADAADERLLPSDKGTKKYSSNQEKAIPFAVAAQHNLKPIPLVIQSVAAGFGNENFSIAESDVKEYYVIPKFRYCQVDFMIEVSGDSMTPHLNSGDVIACTILRDSRFIQWNRIHVIATREQGLLVKRLAPSSDDGCLQAVSDNPKYPPFSIPKDEITGLALVVGSVCLE